MQLQKADRERAVDWKLSGSSWLCDGIAQQVSCALLSGVKPLFLGFQKLIDLSDEFQKFADVLLDSSLLTQFTPTLSGFTLHTGIPRTRYISQKILECLSPSAPWNGSAAIFDLDVL
jgi:hypothetical protein